LRVHPGAHDFKESDMDKREVKKQSDGVQGEGNYDAAGEYMERTRRYVRSGRVEAAARAAAPKDRQEAAELEQAEEAGKRRAARPLDREQP
jgi:hypothetical protein